MPTDRLFFVCAVLTVSCLLLGGGTRAGFLSDVVIQFAAIPLLLMALQRLASLPSRKHVRWALLFTLAVVLVPLLQLIPLPPEVWMALRDREAAAETFQLLAQDTPWLPISVSPRATWLSALSLLPPIAIFLATVVLGYGERRALSLILVALAILGSFVGLMQVADGQISNLRFFEFTNTTEAVGFFANRNHFSAQLYAGTMFAAAWAVEAAALPVQRQARLKTRWIVPVVASFTILVILVAAQGIARSRAGLGLTIIALLATMVVAICDRRSAAGVTPARLLLAATALAVMFAAQFTLYRLLERFTDPLKDGRVTLASVTSEAAQLYMPFGSGMGTFVPAYAMQQRAEDAFIDSYANRAHNDFLELWLEAGVVGLGLLAVFLVWLVGRSWQLWRRTAPGTEIDLSIARAATMAIILLLLHSFVDYPLRTGAIMAIMAFACGLLIAPGSTGADDENIDRGRREAAMARTRTAKSPASAPRHPSDAPISQHPSRQWGRDIEWPEEWR